MLLPDLAAAIKLHLADGTDITALTSTRIWVEWPSGNNKIVVPPFQTCILINTGRGGRGDIGLSLQEERADIFCYAPSRNAAHILWRTLDAYLIDPNTRRQTNFVKARTRVYKVVREGAPLRLIDSDLSDWPYTSAPYIFTYSSVMEPA